MRHLVGLILLYSVGSAACTDVYVQAEPLCLAWGEEVAPPGANVIELLDCQVFRNIANAAVDPRQQFPNADSIYRYACVDKPHGSSCPSTTAARGILNQCFAEQEGMLSPVGGYHSETTVYSACGPDVNATGACCYHTFFLTTSMISAVADRARTNHRPGD